MMHITGTRVTLADDNGHENNLFCGCLLSDDSLHVENLISRLYVWAQLDTTLGLTYVLTDRHIYLWF
jgi:hypothetical protein